MIPSCAHTGTPRHFHSSTTAGSAFLISERMRESVSPRQSPSSLIRASISRDGDSAFPDTLFFIPALSPGLFVLPLLLPALALNRPDRLAALAGEVFQLGIPRHRSGVDRARPAVGTRRASVGRHAAASGVRECHLLAGLEDSQRQFPHHQFPQYIRAFERIRELCRLLRRAHTLPALELVRHNETLFIHPLVSSSQPDAYSDVVALCT